MSVIRRIGKVCLVTCSLVILAAAGHGQYKGKPVKKDILLNVLRSHQLQTREIVKVINTNGVDFRVTPPVEAELTAAGARPEVIVAAKANFRGAAATGTGKKPPVNAPPSADDLADFSAQSTVVELEKKTKSNPQSYLSHQQLGYRYLMLKNYGEAEKSMRQAMALGGSGVFPVQHDHGNGTFAAGCTGTVYVSNDGVHFESNTEIQDTFAIPDRDIKEIKMNKAGLLDLFKFKKGSFHIKLQGRNYNFAPVSGNSEESKLLIKLVGK